MNVEACSVYLAGTSTTAVYSIAASVGFLEGVDWQSKIRFYRRFSWISREREEPINLSDALLIRAIVIFLNG